ncbi:MAG: SCO family protein [Chloroflexota bacterium]|nr:SCO family protein [Chloroflexota bacterium]
MRWLLRRRTLYAVLVLDLLLLSLAMVAYLGLSRGQVEALDDYGEAPSWTLTDQLGRQVSSDELGGKVVVANFIYTNCRDTCPLLSHRMQLLQRRLREEGLLGERVQLLSFSTDPDRDTPEALRTYSGSFQADPKSWRFLTGPEAEMRRIVVGGFKLGVEEVPLEGTPHAHGDGSTHQHSYDVMHSNRFVLVDSKGRIRALYDGNELDIDRVVRDIRRLLG